MDDSNQALYSGILSFNDTTTLIVVKDETYQLIRVPRGFVIIFSVDCFHCGSEYINTGDNKRLFFKVMSQGHAISKEEEDQVNNMPMKCPLCSCPCRIQRAVSTHIRMKCDKASPDVITLREDRKRKQKEWDNKYKRKKT